MLCTHRRLKNLHARIGVWKLNEKMKTMKMLVLHNSFNKKMLTADLKSSVWSGSDKGGGMCLQQKELSAQVRLKRPRIAHKGS